MMFGAWWLHDYNRDSSHGKCQSSRSMNNGRGVPDNSRDANTIKHASEKESKQLMRLHQWNEPTKSIMVPLAVVVWSHQQQPWWHNNQPMRMPSQPTHVGPPIQSHDSSCRVTLVKPHKPPWTMRSIVNQEWEDCELFECQKYGEHYSWTTFHVIIEDWTRLVQLIVLFIIVFNIENIIEQLLPSNNTHSTADHQLTVDPLPWASEPISERELVACRTAPLQGPIPKESHNNQWQVRKFLGPNILHHDENMLLSGTYLRLTCPEGFFLCS